jgi:lysyl-tRNA synthetase class 2
MSEVRPAVENASEQNQLRVSKVKALAAAGASPYEITRFDQTHESQRILSDYDALEGAAVSVAGRMVSRRVMGKASFAHLPDAKGQIQIYVRRTTWARILRRLQGFRLGDVLGVTGKVFRTKAGEVSIHAQSVALLTKCLHPLPEKFHGLKDTDLRYRQRYLDLIVNPEVKDTFIKRSKIIRAVGSFWTRGGIWRWTRRSWHPRNRRGGPPSSPT